MHVEYQKIYEGRKANEFHPGVSQIEVFKPSRLLHKNLVDFNNVWRAVVLFLKILNDFEDFASAGRGVVGEGVKDS
jgi:hypothetical protein